MKVVSLSILLVSFLLGLMPLTDVIAEEHEGGISHDTGLRQEENSSQDLTQLSLPMVCRSQNSKAQLTFRKIGKSFSLQIVRNKVLEVTKNCERADGAENLTCKIGLPGYFDEITVTKDKSSGKISAAGIQTEAFAAPTPTDIFNNRFPPPGTTYKLPKPIKTVWDSCQNLGLKGNSAAQLMSLLQDKSGVKPEQHENQGQSIKKMGAKRVRCLEGNPNGCIVTRADGSEGVLRGTDAETMISLLHQAGVAPFPVQNEKGKFQAWTTDKLVCRAVSPNNKLPAEKTQRCDVSLPELNP